MPDSHVKFHSANDKRLLLIVEDEAVNRELLALVLQETYDLVFAATGAEALAVLAARADDLSMVLLDLNLPDMRGTDILRHIKEAPRYAWLPVIVLTSDRDAEVESLSLGAIDFISKPYPMPSVILARVLRTIELSEDRDILRSTERDHLTGLYNQEFFYRYAEQYDMHHKDVSMDAIVIDVNHFHMINERYGKAYGDEVLRRIGESVRNIVKDSGGIVCRHEADTFYVYCPHRADYPTILDIATAGLADSEHNRSHVRLRIGVYSDTDKTLDIERRFDRARMAANTVRSNFTKAIAIYDNALHESELFEEHLLEGFHDALRDRQFQVYYQPKFDIRSVEPVLTSAEALVRWKNPELGMINPGVFIPLFERNGLILELDTYVWREVARQMRDWKQRLGVSVPVSVNVSRVDMYDEDFVKNLKALVKEYGLSTDELLLEITESAYTEDSDQIVDTVQKLRAEGFRIEMDDFGAGYSSLNMVAELPIDALKLDMQFVRNAFKGRKDIRMLEVILEIAESLMVPSIAEGVETAEQMFALKAMGCGVVQGYYFSRPIPAAEYERFLLAYRDRGARPVNAFRHVERPKRGEGMRLLNEKYTYEAMHDPATGLYNESAFAMLLKDADRNHIALLLAEAEGAGDARQEADDAVARRIAEVLRGSFRSVDFICRIHRNEYVVIMTRVDSALRELVMGKVERINAALARPQEGLAPAQLSFGVAFADRNAPRGNLIEDAELALARGKKLGLRCSIY